MRRSLLFKLMLCYIITVSLMFMGANTLGNYILSDYLTTNLYEQLNLNASNMAHGTVIKKYYSTLLTNDNTTEKKDETKKTDSSKSKKNAKDKNTSKKDTNNNATSNETIENLDEKLEDTVINNDVITYYLQMISQATTYNIWLLDADGNFLNDSNNNITSDENILDYNNRFFYLDTHRETTIPKLVDKPSIFSIEEIVLNGNHVGYLVVFTDVNSVNTLLDTLIPIMNIAILLCAAIILVMFILIYFLTVHPIHKITNFAIEASQGKFNKKVNIRSNDECKDLANAVFYLTSELNNIDEYQRNFISNISHDFRSPLTSIKGYLEAMLDGTIPPDNYNKYLNTILFEAERLTGLTTNLLTLNQLDNTKQLLNKTDFDINYIIRKTTDLYEGVCQKNKITLETNFESEHQFVTADQAKIQQVINNILDNAIKFSPHNSSIIISTYVKVEKVFITIKDHGQGIPKESLSRIWERFYKSDTSRGKDKKGTGLGLAITKEIINAHHENINVISTVGVGTEFSFSLPKAK